MADTLESRDAEECSTNRTSNGVKALCTLLVCYVLSPYAIWGGLANIGLANWTIDPLSKNFYAPLRFLSDHFDFIDRFYRWECDLFWS